MPCCGVTSLQIRQTAYTAFAGKLHKTLGMDISVNGLILKSKWLF
jgi:hypothetical protein